MSDDQNATVFPEVHGIEYCACGQPLHYQTPHAQELGEEQIRELGPHIRVVVADGKWLVPRHYIALHGIKAEDLSQVAEQYGFTRVD